jgi:hypothetical protein
LVLARDRDDQSQVVRGQALLGLEVAALDAARELELLVGRQQTVPAGLVEELLAARRS